ncbi:alpha/beta fold hydrolase [Mycolicibacterium gilvum]|uniref:Hydrolase, alpha/beta fold family protein, putative n=1 Tax=Mycolicibacterium gilvum TaxID=1804 RepID=A0A378SV69_9MYCO|nr:alpha/beta hydrolase [Mycolicibacterium gilvum]MCV7055490.1 alpha/beta hydrolase [Mycolicibacterium gilvum]STZ45267.1 hydrolase, alpha/beta fold family protein, putative [Mycolicibacterium gilvum]
MALPGLVLVHGGGYAGDCWDPTVAELRRQEPALDVLAIDLPGRRSRPGDLRTVTFADWVDSAVRDVDAAGLDQIVLAGHSLAGLTIPGMAAKLGAARVRELVFAAASVPPAGATVTDTIGGIAGVLARRRRGVVGPGVTPRWFARYSYTNGMTRAQRRLALERLYPESARAFHEPVYRTGMPDDVPRTWILTTRDRALSPKCQRAGIAALGGVQKLIEMDTCHNLMISEPTRLAEILIERCRLHPR